MRGSSRRKQIDEFLAFPAIVSIITLVVGVILSEVQNSDWQRHY